MATHPLSRVVDHLRRAALLHDGPCVSDKDLLDAFLVQRQEVAFEALVRRHGPMVLGVCQRILRDCHGAEDAFQATFMVFIKKAASIRKKDVLASWLYGVAQRTAMQARSRAARRQAKERQVANMAQEPAAADDAIQEMLPFLDQELTRLPDKYRTAIILCDLRGKTRKAAAQELGLPEGTLSTRLLRGRAMLAKRLARHGFSPSEGPMSVALVTGKLTMAVPHALTVSTSKAGILVAAGKTTVAGALSVTVAALTEKVVKTMLLSKLKNPLAVLTVVFLLAMGTGTVSRLAVADIADYPVVAPAPVLVVAAEPSTQDQARTVKEEDCLAVYLSGISIPNATITGKTTGDPKDRSLARPIPLGNVWEITALPSTKVIIDGKAAAFADLKTLVPDEMSTITVYVEWEYDVFANRKDLIHKGRAKLIEAFGAIVDVVVRNVDVQKNMIRVNIPWAMMMLVDVPIAKDAKVKIHGTEAKLAELKPGMRAALQMSARPEESSIVGISVRRVEKEE